MTYPGQGGPNDPGNYPQWQQQPPVPGQPTPGQQDWQQQQQQWQGGPYPQTAQFPQQPYQGQGHYGPFPPGGYPGGRPPRRRKRGLIVGLVVALVAAAGGVATWLAISLSSPAGAETPSEAANTMLAAVQQGDVVGMMDSLAPAESAVLSDMVTDYVDELKRLEILDSSADPEKLSGVTMEATEELVFDDKRAKKINDHVTMAALTDGTIRFSSDFDQIPLAKKFKDAVIDPQDQAELEAESPSGTLDIGEVVQRGGEPIYIATVNVDGEWYPSLFYTIAYYALQDAGEQWPSSSTPAVGADSPNAAVKKLIEGVRTSDLQKVIEVLPPDEMGVLHDLGPLLIEKAGPPRPPLPFEVTKLETDEESVSGGTRLTLRELEVVINDDGVTRQISVTKDGDCYTVQADGRSQRLCANDLADRMRADVPSDIPPQAVEPIIEVVQNLFTKSLGVVTVEVDGQHYVSPLRTYGDLGLTVLKSIEPHHVQALLDAIGPR